MSIAFRSFSGTGAGGVTSVTLSKPAGVVAGDLLVASLNQTPGTSAITPPAGWTAELTAGRLQVFWKLAGGGEPDAYTFTSGDVITVGAVMVAYSGAHQSDPVPRTLAARVYSSSENQGPASFGSSAITPPNRNGLVAWAVALDPENQGGALATPTFTQGDSRARWGGSNVPVGFADRPGPTTDSTLVAADYLTASQDNDFQWRTYTFAIRPANVPPNAPTPTAPASGSVQPRTATIRLAATFSDPDVGDTPSASDWRYRITGTATWTTVYQGNPLQSYDIAAGLAAGDYEWQARFYDQSGLVRSWSASAFFTAATPPAGPTIVDPVNGQTLPAASYTVTFSFPTPDAWEWRLLDLDGNILAGPVLVSGAAASGRTFTLTGLVNGTTVRPQVRVQDDGLWSPWTDSTNPVSYTPPALPTVTLTSDDGSASVTVALVNPAPTGSEPAVTAHDLYVRAVSGRDPYRPFTDGGIRIFAGLLPGATAVDRAVASGVDYEYRVVSHAANGTTSTTGWFRFDPGDFTDTFAALYV